jgi:hypothetical protein
MLTKSLAGAGARRTCASIRLPSVYRNGVDQNGGRANRMVGIVIGRSSRPLGGAQVNRAEVAAVVFLASDASSFLSAAIWLVDTAAGEALGPFTGLQVHENCDDA